MAPRFGSLRQWLQDVPLEVEQYASPVHLECPEEVQASLTGKKNYAPVAWVEPDHTNGRAHQDNNPVNVRC